MKISLLENASTFVEEALSKAVQAEHDPIQWKFAILNIVQSIELSFKERLRREHELFIYTNIDKPDQTVSLDISQRRLTTTCGIHLSDEERKAIAIAKKKRHEIVHYEFTLNPKELKPVFAQLLEFLIHFFETHLETTLDSNIKQTTWQDALSIVYYADTMYAAACRLIGDQSHDHILQCPKCHYDTFVSDDDINTCYVCRHHESVYECEKCHGIFFLNEIAIIDHGDSLYSSLCHDCNDDELSCDYYYEMTHGK